MKNIQLETNNGGRYVKEELSMCFHLFADNSPDGMIITNSDDTILYINPSAQRLLNYHEDGNGSLSSFIPTDEVKTYWDKPTTINYNRKTLYVSVKTANLKDSPLYLWYISDNTLYKQQANELYCLKTILDCVDEGIVMSDQENKITLYNKSYADHEGLSQDEVVGKHLDEVYDSNVHATALKTGLPITDIYKTYSTRNGIEQEGMGKTYPVIKNNEVIAVFSVVKNVSVVRSLLQKAVELQEKLTNKMEPNGTKYTFESIIGESEVMVNTIKKARVVAMSPSPILIYGETGTGKELFAQSIHNSGPYADQPFVAINCAAVPESLFESILFGTVKGSFTGAQNLQGVFEQAGNGTLFLDEINSMPMAMQAKLLRALQEKVVRRVGATYEIPVKCRIITSSNEEPEACVEKGTLRRDIYYRLALLRINIPPLREREKDVEVLAEYFLKKKSRLYGKKNIKLSTEFSNYLYQRPWPGNVRELEHTLESCVAMIEDGEELQLCHLPSHLKRTKIIHNRYQTTSTNNDLLNNIQATTLAAALREVEKKVILNSLQNHHWNISRAAKAIGIGRQNLQYRMNKLNIEKPCRKCKMADN
ncbi:MAG: sigma 54-interacting transcriptional regulator [Syntrophaceticus schinkii]|jgi:arginine utilization regulatory protein|nr:sigma 54-interacting transcriptional regulator [Syntrophaceticus schinkii]MDD4262317.1 sigma 54-interacting transcriptional regulator [Syntrophaceticus schinkii]